GYLGEAISERLVQMADESSRIYDQTGSWESIQDYLDQSSNTYRGMGSGVGMMGQRGRGPNGQTQSTASRVLFVVDAVTGQALTFPAVQPVDPDVLAVGAPVWVNGVEIARVVDTRDSQSAIQAAIGPAEQTFLNRMNQALVISSVVAGLVALLVGSLLAYSMLKPLSALEEGVMAVAQGKLDTQVPVHGRDEIGQLAAGFNRMAANLHRQETLRQRMVADIAHELRTPLSVVQGNLQALLDGVYPLEKSEISTIYDETRVLSRLIQDLHELAQAEAGNLPLVMQQLAVDDVVTHMAALFRPLAEERAIRITTQTPPTSPIPLLALGDADRVQQILHNLMGNGLRHTPAAGTLRLTAQVMADGKVTGTGTGGGTGVFVGRKETKGGGIAHDGYAKFVRFSVTDSGPGIPSADLPHIFDRFYRGDPSRSREGDAQTERHTSGAGLGLAIVKALVEAQGGRVGVDSQPGHGATFWFDLPTGA
ncbi:MAG: HAMP domain-containing protein, partial [Caldilineaceae bacterium]|nr:HAMP domain-containing protein [Caldilineaceae bacterium]